jgi:hypothetical protein
MADLAMLALGRITSTRSSVMMLVARQVTSVTWPTCPGSTSIQSPTSKGRCICSASPETRLPSVSCNDRPMTAVSSAEVVKIDPGSTPSACSATSATTR